MLRWRRYITDYVSSLEVLEIGEGISNLRHRARDASRVLPSAPLDRPPNNNNIIELLPLDRDIPTGRTPRISFFISCLSAPVMPIFRLEMLQS